MGRYLIDVNLPHRFSLWSGSDYHYVRDINAQMPDSEIW
jgi:hypothetical protein